MKILASRWVAPVVMGIFLTIYVAIAFFTDEALTALIALVGHSMILAALFALLPINCACRIVSETRSYLRRRRLLAGGADQSPAQLFDETVTLQQASTLAGLDRRLTDAGYRTGGGEGTLSAWRGISGYPFRMLYLAGAFCLFSGVLISLTMRGSERVALIEGEPLPQSAGGGRVERISLNPPTGSILAKELAMQVAPPDGGSTQTFGLYPPGHYAGAYVYPRYLGMGVFVTFSAPDLPGPFEKHAILNIHPAGKEDGVEVPGSPYRLVFSLQPATDGSDPYVTGKMAFDFKVLKGKDLVLSGSAPSGGQFAQGGYRVAIPDSRRLVLTDFIRDNGVIMIWIAGIFFAAAALCWLPIRLFSPRREMHFTADGGLIHAFCRAEGKARRHGEVFTEALDTLESRRQEKGAVAEGAV